MHRLLYFVLFAFLSSPLALAKSYTNTIYDGTATSVSALDTLKWYLPIRDSLTVVVPTNLSEALVALDRLLSVAHKREIRGIKSETEFPQNHHRVLGFWLQIHWGLFNSSALVTYFNQLGVHDPSHISAIILQSYYRHLHGLPIRFDSQIEAHLEYLERKRVDRERAQAELLDELRDEWLAQEQDVGIRVNGLLASYRLPEGFGFTAPRYPIYLEVTLSGIACESQADVDYPIAISLYEPYLLADTTPPQLAAAAIGIASELRYEPIAAHERYNCWSLIIPIQFE